MFKFLFTLLVSILIYSPLLSQSPADSVKIKTTPLVDAQKAFYTYQIRSASDNSFFLLKFNQMGFGSNKSLIIQKYDQNSELKHKMKYEKEDLKGNYIEALVQNEKVYVISTDIRKSMNIANLWLSEIDQNTLEITNQRLLIEYSYEGWEINSFQGFFLKPSMDKSKLLILYGNPTESFVQIKVLDNAMQELWGKKESIPYKDYELQIMDAGINDKGDVFFATSHYKDIKTEPYQQICVSKEKKEITKLKINTKGNFIPSLSFRVIPLEDGSFVCSGFYSQSLKSFIFKIFTKPKVACDFAGTFFFKSNEAADGFEVEKFNAFSLDFLIKSEKKKDANKVRRNWDKKGFGIYENVFLSAVLQDEDGIVVLGEEYYKKSSSSKEGGSPTHFIKDLIVIKYTLDGSVKWSNKIVKLHQIESRIYKKQYAASVINGVPHFLFTEWESYLDLNHGDAIKDIPFLKKKHSVLAWFENGELKKKEINSYLPSKTMLIIQSSHQLNSKEIVIYRVGRKGEGFLHLEF